MKVLAFAASSSKSSINKQLVTYACSLCTDAEIEIADLNDYELPLFSVDREAELGQPTLAQQFFTLIGAADALIISFAEHNGSYTAAYKNLFDWCSRIDTKVFQNKPMVVLSTSLGKRGGAGVMATILQSAPHFGGEVRASLSVPSFNENFDSEVGKLSNPQLDRQLFEAIQTLIS